MKRKQPVQSRALATCEAIVDATVQVILRDGVSHLTTGRVAERAGVSIGTLYQYFANKDDLIAAVRARHVTFLIAAAARAIDLAQTHSPRSVLHSALEDFLRFKRDNLALSRALIGLAGAPETQDTPADVNRRFAELLAPLLHDRPDGADRLTQARLMVAALDGVIGQAVIHAPDWLNQRWFLDVLVGLAMSFFQTAARAPDDLGPRHVADA